MADPVASSPNPVVSAIGNATTAFATRLALLFGSYEEASQNPTAVGDGGTSFGTFQLHEGGALGDLPGTLQQQIAEADDPAQAVQDWALNAYQGAAAQVNQYQPSLYGSNPEQWAEEVAATAERPQGTPSNPATPNLAYNINRGQASVDLSYNTAIAELGGASGAGSTLPVQASGSASDNSGTAGQQTGTGITATELAYTGPPGSVYPALGNNFFLDLMIELDQIMNPKIPGFSIKYSANPLKLPGDVVHDIGGAVVYGLEYFTGFLIRWFIASMFLGLAAFGVFLVLKNPIEAVAAGVVGEVTGLNKLKGLFGGGITQPKAPSPESQFRLNLASRRATVAEQEAARKSLAQQQRGAAINQSGELGTQRIALATRRTLVQEQREARLAELSLPRTGTHFKGNS